jgi:hypothetical protein
MRKSLAAVTALFLATLVVGCGGGGTGIPNPLAGDFIGTGTRTPTGGSTNASIIIDPNGALFGTVYDSTQGGWTYITGHVSSHGEISNGGAQIRNSSAVIVGNSSVSGSFTETPTGTQDHILSGTLNLRVSSTIVTYTLTNLVQTHPVVDPP